MIPEFKDLNEDVNNAAKGEKFITFFAGHYDKKNKTLQYVNAGHNYPILTNKKETKFLNKGCIGLGMLEDIPKIEVNKIKFQQDTRAGVFPIHYAIDIRR